MARLAGDGSHYSLSKVLWQLKNDIDYEIQLPSVTTILEALPKYGLQWWGYKLGVGAVLDHIAQGNKVDGADVEALYEELKKSKRITPQTELTKAGDRGTQAHHSLERYLKGEAVSEEEASNPYHRAGVMWHISSGLVPKNIIGVEIPLFSLKHGYAGTCDVLGDVLVDFKTSKSIYESHLIQVVAYGAAAVEMGLLDEMPRCVVVGLKPNGTYVEKESHATIEDFLAVKGVYDSLERMKGAA